MTAERILQVTIGTACAGAIFQKQSAGWVCTAAAPYLRKLGIVGQAANDVKALLDSKDAAYEWVKSEKKEKPWPPLRKQSDGQYDTQVRCCDCQRLIAREAPWYKRDIGSPEIPYCPVRYDPPGSEYKGFYPDINRWRNCREFE